MASDEIDPLDAYMASLCVPSVADECTKASSTAETAAAANALDWSTARRWRCASAQHNSASNRNEHHTNGNDEMAPEPNCITSSAVVKNRRYRRLQQLLQGEKIVQDPSQPGAMEANPADWYFSDAMMQQRNPALFHFHLGQYLPAAHAAAAAAEHGPPTASSSSSTGSSGAEPLTTTSDTDELLSSFLLSTNDRREMEVRRALEQRTWGKFTAQDITDARAREKALYQHDSDEEEEEEEDESSSEDEKTKSDDTSAVPRAETAVDIAERRQVLVDLMIQRFLQGSDHEYVDYREIDANAALDDLEQMQRDAEDAYFDMDED